MKRIKDIFTEHNTDINLSEAFVEGVVINKDTKTLNMKINSNNYIRTKEIAMLNKFIKRRFGLEDSLITVHYNEGTVKIPISEEMENIIDILSDDFPVLKAAFNNCSYEISKSKIKFRFKNTISDYLKVNDYDREIQNFIEKIYGDSYDINFIDDVGNEEIEKLMDDIEAKEMQIIKEEQKIK